MGKLTPPCPAHLVQQNYSLLTNSPNNEYPIFQHNTVFRISSLPMCTYTYTYTHRRTHTHCFCNITERCFILESFTHTFSAGLIKTSPQHGFWNLFYNPCGLSSCILYGQDIVTQLTQWHRIVKSYQTQNSLRMKNRLRSLKEHSVILW